jgi:sulfonate transport system permease protein
VGNLLVEGSEHFEMDLVLVGMAVIGLLGWTLNALARKLERRLLHWTGR